MTTPTQPSPAFNGDCALAVSLGNKGVPGNPKHSVTEDGTVYFFKNPVAKVLWKIIPGRAKRAEKRWQAD